MAKTPPKEHSNTENNPVYPKLATLQPHRNILTGNNGWCPQILRVPRDNSIDRQGKDRDKMRKEGAIED